MEQDVEAKLILDFLYADHEKVASILSQIDDHAAPKITAVRGQRGRDNKAGAGLKLPGMSADASATRNLQYEVRQEHDPLWINSRRLVERVLDSPVPERPKIGQIRVLEGHLVAFDQSVLSNVMSASSMSDFIAAGMIDSEAGKRSQKVLNEKKKEAEVVKTYIASLPLSISFILLTSEGGFWFNINKTYLYLHELDVPMKFPIVISGVWKALGIVDALPHDQFALEHLDGVCAGEHIPAIMSNLGQLIGATSVGFGRRLDSFGLKPLAVFRNVDL